MKFLLFACELFHIFYLELYSILQLTGQREEYVKRT